MKVIILAGGVGKRLWPISKRNKPKQFLNLFDQKSLLQRTIERFDNVSDVDHILISTNIKFKKLFDDNIPKSSKKISIVYEPLSKNTAPAIALSVKYLIEKFQIKANEPILVMPSDSQIEPIQVFFKILSEVNKKIEGILTFGIRPTRADVNYGYILVKSIDQIEKPIIKFIEKPPIEIAEKIYTMNSYFWNSGMFLFTLKGFIHALKFHNYELFKFFKQNLKNCLSSFSALPNISFDHAIMEKINNGFCVPLDVSWSDIGSWESLYDILSKDKNQNAKIGNIVDLDTRNSLIIGQKKLVSTIGLDNIIYVETDEAIFLARKGKSSDLKRLLELIKLNQLKT